jgi:hypothetical protein
VCTLIEVIKDLGFHYNDDATASSDPLVCLPTLQVLFQMYNLLTSYRTPFLLLHTSAAVKYQHLLSVRALHAIHKLVSIYTV